MRSIRIKEFGWFLKLVLPKDVEGITLWPFGIYIREIGLGAEITIRHESIHWLQQMELPVIFYLWYLIEWISKGYYNISFEREAYTNQYNTNYLETRGFCEFINYL